MEHLHHTELMYLILWVIRCVIYFERVIGAIYFEQKISLLNVYHERVTIMTGENIVYTIRTIGGGPRWMERS